MEIIRRKYRSGYVFMAISSLLKEKNKRKMRNEGSTREAQRSNRVKRRWRIFNRGGIHRAHKKEL